MLKVALLGLGLVGGSLGLALQDAMRDKEASGGGFQIVGYDEDRQAQREARLRGVIDRAADRLEEAVQDAGLIVIDGPAHQVGEMLRLVGPHLEPGAIVTDTANTKAQTLRWAKDFLPSEVSFIGGHPIFAPEKEVDWDVGIKGARPELLQNAIYCLCPARSATDQAIETISGMVHMVGANAYFLDALEHDGLLAGTSHLPHLLAAAMMYTTASSASWRDLKLLTDPFFRHLNWMITPPAAALHQAALTNRQSLLSWLDRVVGVLQQVRQELSDDHSDGRFILDMLEEAQAARRDWIQNRDEREGEAGSDSMAGVETPGQQMLHMFVPRFFQRKPPEEE
ncbi:MAG: prephenate dehydrogenase [Chloroflexia bacterium]|nr:prephenate dehydrogenase [Chloroflexia bacterium]